MTADFTELRGDRIIIRPFDARDITDIYLGWLNDREVTRYSNQRFRRHDRASCEAYLAGFAGTANLFVSVCDGLSGSAIGTMTAYRNTDHGTCDVGIMIGERQRWGRGYGQEAWTMFTNWLLTHGGVRKLTAGCLATNVGMIVLMERSGMHPEAVLERHEIVDGTLQDVVRYARFGTFDGTD